MKKTVLFLITLILLSVLVSAQNDTASKYVEVIEMGENTTEAAPKITEEDAFHALVRAQEDIAQMQRANLGIVFTTDTLIKAKKAFAGENITAILQEIEKINDTAKKQYAMTLYLATLKAAAGETKVGENYTQVLELCDLIRQRKDEAYKLMDDLQLLKMELNSLNRTIANYTPADKLFADATTAFKEERYEEARQDISETYEVIQTITIESTRMRALLKASRRNLKNFVKDNWGKLIIGAIVLIFIICYIIDKKRYFKLKHKIKDWKIEQNVLQKLTKQAQRDYYQKGSISKSMFDIKLKKYKARETTIKEQMPVLLANKKKYQWPFIFRTIGWMFKKTGFSKNKNKGRPPQKK